MLRLFFLERLQKQERNKKTREVESNQMNKKKDIEKFIKQLYIVVDKLEKRIATLEKVLDSHAKCIGELRGTELRIHDLKDKKDH